MDPILATKPFKLAFIGSHKVNGVSALHTDLMKQTVFRGLNGVFPDRIINQTNGITPRRWLYECNPGLAGLVTEAIGEGWVTDLEQIEELVAYLDRELGRLLSALEAHPRFDDLLLIVTSDHGEAFGEHGLLRHSASLYQELLAVPLVIKSARGREAMRSTGSMGSGSESRTPPGLSGSQCSSALALPSGR